MAYNSTHTGLQIDNFSDRISDLETSDSTNTNEITNIKNLLTTIINNITNMWQTIYPVGSIYVSTNSTNPETLFGGTWVLLKDRFLLAAGDTYTAGGTGGAASVTSGGTALTTALMPAHTHTRGTMNITGHCVPAHSSGVCYLNVTGAAGAFYTGLPVDNCGKVLVSGTWTADRGLFFDASRNWTGETSSVGSGNAHTHTVNTLPPYLAVYIWKRTA